MNNSDHNDFMNWQNGDENPEPNNFFYYGPWNEKFRDMWNKMHQNIDKNDYIEQMKDYMNLNDPPSSNQYNKEKNRRQRQKSKFQKETILSQEDYLKLIEIRGYLSITEQYAHVKALDKLINRIQIVERGPK
jgi:hypothetical protein